MKIIILTFTALSFYSALAFSQTFTSVKDTAAMRQKMNEAALRTLTIQCDFTQEKNMSMLSDKAVSKGRFYFMKEGKVRLEYMQPTFNLIVMNNGKLLMKDDKKTTVTDVHKNRAFQQLNNIIVGSISGNLFSNKEFTSKFFETTSQIKVELIPVNKTMRNFLSNIVIVMEKKDFTATRIEMNEPSGDNTILTFTSKEINKAIGDTLFAVK
jgi:outer membrane lipoprotein-sorting protein